MRPVAWNGLRTINFLYGLHFWDPSTSLIINNIFKLLFQKITNLFTITSAIIYKINKILVFIKKTSSYALS